MPEILLDAIPDSDKIIFKATGSEKAVIDVFTDTSCLYCKKLHAELPTLQEAGVTVRYLPFTRGGVQGPGFKDLNAVYV